jgi:hypothetical protein
MKNTKVGALLGFGTIKALPEPKKVQTVDEAFKIFDDSLSGIHKHNDQVVAQQQQIINDAKIVQDIANDQVQRTENFKENFSKLFDKQ